MPALYVTLVFVGGWMALATWGPLHRVDAYPFPFLLFLNNVVQLVLCSVILVGQRVLGMAADHRAVQTYENAESIFAQVADLQEHLDRHDQVLSRGVSLLESSPHPWIERHRVQPPPQATDQAVSVNGRIAARLTQLLGSMWTFYASALTQVAWIVLAEAGVQRFDLYPFAFMTFLSTLAQLIFMVVIMVGQDVLGQAADRRRSRRSWTRRRSCRLPADEGPPDRAGPLLDSISAYATAQVTEQLAQALHDARATWKGAAAAAAARGRCLRCARGRPAGARPRPGAPARRDAGLDRLPAGSRPRPGVGRHVQRRGGPAAGPARARALAGRAGSTSPGGRVRARQDVADPRKVPWEQLTDRAREKYVQAARGIPATLASVGFQVLRDGACPYRSEVAAVLLLALDRLEQRLEVALAEAE